MGRHRKAHRASLYWQLTGWRGGIEDSGWSKFGARLCGRDDSPSLVQRPSLGDQDCSIWVAMLDHMHGGARLRPTLPSAPCSMLQGDWKVYVQEATVGNGWRNWKSSQYKCLIAFLHAEAFTLKGIDVSLKRRRSVWLRATPGTN
jgi:hypothetical protein